jgi:hypothetical protein
MDSLSVAHRVVEAVADEKSISPAEVSKPLYDVIDTDALNRLVERPLATGTTGVDLRFEYLECAVSVLTRDDGEVSVRATELSPTPSAEDS